MAGPINKKKQIKPKGGSSYKAFMRQKECIKPFILKKLESPFVA